MLMKIKEEPNTEYERRLVELQEAHLDRIKAVEHYAQTQEKNQMRANLKYKDKNIREGDLVLR